jgi:hypothetical protein
MPEVGLAVCLLASGHGVESKHDPRGEAVRRGEELDLPGELPGDPQAATGSRTWCQVARGGIVEAGAGVDDLASEASDGPSDACVAHAA